MSSLSLVDRALRALGGDAKKQKAVRETAEKASLAIRQQQGQPTELVNSGALVDPVYAALESSSPADVLKGLDVLQLLAEHGLLTQEQCPSVCSKVVSCCQVVDDAKMRTLQVCGAMFNNSAFLHSKQSVGMMIELVFGMSSYEGGRQPQQPLAHVSTAVVTQMCLAVFTSLAEQSQSQEEDLELIASSLLSELVSILQRKSTKWIIAPSDLNPSTIIEIVDNCLETHSSLVRSTPSLLSTVSNHVIPYLKFALDTAKPFPLMIRVLRLICTVIIRFGMQLVVESESLLAKLVRTLEEGVLAAASWRTVVTIESVRFLCAESDPSLLRALYLRHDHASEGRSVFTGLVHALGRVAQVGLQKSTPSSGGPAQHPIIHASKLKCLEMLGQSEAPTLSPGHGTFLSLDALSGIVDALTSLMSRILRGDIAGNTQTKRTPRVSTLPVSLPVDTPAFKGTEDCTIVEEMIEAAWPPLLAALSNAIAVASDEDVLQQILKAYQGVIHVCGILHLVTPRDAFLTSMTKMVLPTKLDQALSKRNVQVARALFHIAFITGNFLENAWAMVWEVFDRLEECLPNDLNAPSTVEIDDIAGLNSPASSSDLAMLRDMLENLYAHCSSLEPSALKFVLQSLDTVTQVSVSGKHGEDMVPRMAAWERLCQVVTNNLGNIKLVWPLLVNTVNSLVLSNKAEVRDRVMKSFLATLNQAIKYHLVDRPTADSPSLEILILSPLEVLNRSEQLDVREAVVNILHIVLQANGQALSQGWPLILTVVKTVAVEGENKVMAKSFQILQLILSDFLNDLPVDCMQLFITTTAAFGLQQHDTNVALTAVGLLWTIADFLSRDRTALSKAFTAVVEGRTDGKVAAVSSLDTSTGDSTNEKAEAQIVEQQIKSASQIACEQVDGLWTLLMKQLRTLSVDSRPEVRHCAIRTLTSAFNEHAKDLDHETWTDCLFGIVLKTLDDVSKCSQTATGPDLSQTPQSLGVEGGKEVQLLVHHSRNTAEKQWSETRVLILSTVSKVIRHSLLEISQHPRGIEVWENMLSCVREYGQSTSEEVARCSLSVLQQFMDGLDAGSQLPHPWREGLWETIIHLLKSAVSSSCSKFQSETIELLQAISTTLLDIGTEQQVTRVVSAVSELADVLSSSPLGVLSCELAQWQERVVNFRSERAVWCSVLNSLSSRFEMSSSVLEDLDSKKHNHAANYIVQCLECVERLAQMPPPSSVLRHVGDTLVQRVASAASSRAVDASSKIWGIALSSQLYLLSALIQLRDKHLVQSSENSDELVDGMQPNETTVSASWFQKSWLEHCRLLGRFLFAALEVWDFGDDTESVLSRIEDADVDVLNFCASTLLPAAAGDKELITPVLRLIDQAVDQITRPRGSFLRRERVATFAIQFLFDCSHMRAESLSAIPEEDKAVIANCALPLVVSRCQTIFECLLTDSDAEGGISLPKFRISQIALLASLLLDGGSCSHLQDGWDLIPSSGLSGRQRKLLKYAGNHAILCASLPWLCKCMGTADSAVRMIIVDCASAAVKHLGCDFGTARLMSEDDTFTHSQPNEHLPVE